MMTEPSTSAANARPGSDQTMPTTLARSQDKSPFAAPCRSAGRLLAALLLTAAAAGPLRAEPATRPSSGSSAPPAAVKKVDLGMYHPKYGYPAPKWFRELEVLCMASWGPLPGTMECTHSAGGFQAAKDGFYAAGPFADAGLADLRTWNGMGSRVTVYQDNLSYGIIEHNLGIEWCRKNRGADWVYIPKRWQAGQAGWPGKYVNKDGHEDEWCLYDKDGKWVWKWGFYPGRHLSCVNTPGVWNAWRTAVRSLMDMGHDGIMFDNFSRSPAECYGQKLGKHEHLFPDKSNREVVGNLYREIFRIIKGYHPDRVMWCNSHAKAPWIWFDGQVIESIFGHSKFEERPSADIFAYAVATARKHQEAIEHGKVVIYMPYVRKASGKGKGIPGNATDRQFFGYAAARLGNCVAARMRYRGDDGKKRWADGPFLWLRLKKVRGGIIELRKGVHIRCYDRGVVVLNGTDAEQTLALPLDSPEMRQAGSVIDVYTGQAYPVGQGARTVRVRTPAWSGRVFATEAAYRLARDRKLPDRPATWTAPLLPGRQVAPPEAILQGPEAFRRWHRDHPDTMRYRVAPELQ